MYVVELAFGDDPARLAARPAHRQLLARLRTDGTVLKAGPFPDDSGALLIFDVDDRAELDRLMEQDAYYAAPGVTVVRRQPWSPDD